jgi:three-Cys-motif partner protein
VSDADLYIGREQTLVKHLILRRYIERFAHIIGRNWDSITYVDCFSGPWNSRSPELADSSFAIAIRELRKARTALFQKRGKTLDLRCLFLEKDPAAYAELRGFTEPIQDLEIEARNATLESSVDGILGFIRRRPGTFPFIFIDPTGWTGFALDVITRLLRLKPGEVLINFMTGHNRRFIDSPDKVTRQSFERLFGSADFKKVLQGLSGQDRDDAAVFQYMKTVQSAGNFQYASMAMVLHPKIDRSHFHLIYLTRDPRGVEVFKDAERKAMPEMESVRAAARQRKREEQSRQTEMFRDAEGGESRYYKELRNRYLAQNRRRLMDELEARGRIPYDEAWASALCGPLVWEADLKSWIQEWRGEGKLDIEGMQPRQRVPKRKSANVLVWRPSDA